ncbi:MAG TPA: DUF4173 domain-containing protein [Pseudomonadales bacterium]
MNDRPKLVLQILSAGILCGVLGDALLRAGPVGVNVTLWVGFVVAVLLALSASHKVAWSRATYWVALGLLVFAAGFAWRDSPVLKFLDFFALVVVVGVWSLTVEARGVRAWGLLDHLRGLANAGAAALAGAAGLSKSGVSWNTERHAPALRHVRGAALGILIAFPLVFLFGALLMEADAVFDRMVTDAVDIDFATVFSHGALTAFFAWIVCGFTLLMLKVNKPIVADTPRIGRPGLGLLEVAVPLALIDLLFLLFVVVQLRYLFGDASLVQQTVGLTYAEYARRGFFELVMVAALVLPLLLLADWVLAEADRKTQRIFRALAGTQLILLFIILASAVKRMLLYQSAYGLTDARLYTTAFMVWLGVVLVWFVVTVLRGRRQPFVSGALLAGLLTILVLNVLNPDALIARVNTERVYAGKAFDAAYHLSLSGDAAPVLVSALPNLSPDDRCTLAKRLLERWSPSEPDWRTWSLGRSRARKVVAGARAELSEIACEPPADEGPRDPATDSGEADSQAAP